VFLVILDPRVTRVIPVRLDPMDYLDLRDRQALWGPRVTGDLQVNRETLGPKVSKELRVTWASPVSRVTWETRDPLALLALLDL